MTPPMTPERMELVEAVEGGGPSRDHAHAASGGQGDPALAITDAELIDDLAYSNWADIDLAYATVNVRHGRGSLDKETRKTAIAAIQTFRAVLKEARALRDGASSRPTGSKAQAEHRDEPLPSPSNQEAWQA